MSEKTCDKEMNTPAPWPQDSSNEPSPMLPVAPPPSLVTSPGHPDHQVPQNFLDLETKALYDALESAGIDLDEDVDTNYDTNPDEDSAESRDCYNTEDWTGATFSDQASPVCFSITDSPSEYSEGPEDFQLHSPDPSRDARNPLIVMGEISWCCCLCGCPNPSRLELSVCVFCSLRRCTPSHCCSPNCGAMQSQPWLPFDLGDSIGYTQSEGSKSSDEDRRRQHERECRFCGYDEPELDDEELDDNPEEVTKNQEATGGENQISADWHADHLMDEIDEDF
jgi:hypothetical protein